MIAAADFIITKAERSKLSSMSLENISFGKYFTDHMLEVEYADGEWKTVEIKPYQSFSIAPSCAALHYGQAIFEGVKAYKNQDGDAFIFRPEENFKRFNISARRMEMPEVPEEIFIEGMKQLVKLDEGWIPNKPDHALYIRPFMFGCDEMIGVKPCDTYKFMIILSPTGPYYSAPMRLYVEEKYVRAVEGGVGYAKTAGNYGSAMFPTAEAKRKGYDQVLWTDAIEHKYVQECGTMNVFFIIGNKAITPGLEEGTILAGITRDCTIQLLNELGLEVEERRLSIDEVEDAYTKGTLREVFGTGTAATISMIRELCHKDFIMRLDTDSWTIAPKIKNRMDDIKAGVAVDKYGWMLKV
ncbi:MAG: branched-chain amino acid aminotransferase [Bacteroidota bacterium]|nr:branched-chain amino acid aminotransferase [Bacteroidota bacterium]